MMNIVFFVCPIRDRQKYGSVLIHNNINDNSREEDLHYRSHNKMKHWKKLVPQIAMKFKSKYSYGTNE